MKKYLSLYEVRSDLFAHQLQLQALVADYIDRISQKAELNAYVEVWADEALHRAAIIQQKIDSGTAGSLAGLVLGIKDNICYAHHKVSAASKILANFQSTYTATALQRLLDEDAIVLGRLNCDEFAMGSSNENSAYGPVQNACNPERVSGGSSGGSAVAVAANLCLAALGSDTGGSVRQPASLNGVVGFKPTYGRVSRYGLIAYASSFDQIGVVAHCVADAALVTQIMSGADANDSTTAHSVPMQKSIEHVADKKYKVAVLNQSIETEALHPEIKKRIHEVVNRLEQNGHSVEYISLPELQFAIPTYYVLTMAEAASNLARYDGVHFGYRSPNAASLEQVYVKSRTEGFGREVKRRIMLGNFVLSAGSYDAYYEKAQCVRRLIAIKTLEVFTTCDFILSPVTTDEAFVRGEKNKDPLAMYMEDIYTVQANLVGAPAISIPLGQKSTGMPFGIQLMADKFKEDQLLSFAKYLVDELS